VISTTIKDSQKLKFLPGPNKLFNREIFKLLQIELGRFTAQKAFKILE